MSGPLSQRMFQIVGAGPAGLAAAITLARAGRGGGGAGEGGDGAVAAHEIDEMRRLTGISKYIDPKLGALLQAFMDGNLRKLREAVEHGNSKSFQAAVADTVASCNGCHKASGSTLGVSVQVSDTMSMRHPHLLGKTTVPKDHGH